MAKLKRKITESPKLNSVFNWLAGGATDEFLASEAFKEQIANQYLAKNKIKLPENNFYNVENNAFGYLDDAKNFVANTDLADASMNVLNDIDLRKKAIQEKGALAAGAGGDVIRNAIRSHPFKTAGIVGGGIANIAGLTDNDKVGGQLAGLAGGAVIPWLLKASSPSTYILSSLAGGTLGSLFDKLRASQEQDYNQNAYIQG